MTLQGIIVEIMPEKQITEKFCLKEFVLRCDNGKYPEEILFQTSNQNIKLLNSFMEGEAVTVHFNISGRKVKDRYWNSLKVFKIEATGEKENKGMVSRVGDRDENKTADVNNYFDTPETEEQKKVTQELRENDDDSGLPF